MIIGSGDIHDYWVFLETFMISGYFWRHSWFIGYFWRHLCLLGMHGDIYDYWVLLETFVII